MKGAWFARVCNQLTSHWRSHHLGGAGRRTGRRAHRSSRSIRLEHLEARQLLSIDLISAPHPDLVALTGNDASSHPSLSADGRYIAFQSAASNLVPGDTNGVSDIFVRDLQTGTIARVSTDSEGNQGSDGSASPVISADGRYVAFISSACNLVANDTNGKADIFVKDLQTGIITRVNTDSLGNQANQYSSSPSISADGRYVAFVSGASNLVANDTNGNTDIFVKDVRTGITTRVNTDSLGNQANQYSSSPSISADGRYVAFDTSANNLVADDANGRSDVFVKDLRTGTITRVSTDSEGRQAEANGDSSRPAISADGRYVAFVSSAGNLVSSDGRLRSGLVVKDVQTGAVTFVANVVSSAEFSLSADGRYLTYDCGYEVPCGGGGTVYVPRLFVRDLQTGGTTLASTDSEGNEVNARFSNAAISADGRHVAFVTDGSTLVSGDANGASDVFVKDLLSGELQLASQRDAGIPELAGNDRSGDPDVSADGRYVVFESDASNLVPDDTNGARDVFLKDMETGIVTRVSTDSSGNQARGGGSRSPAISADGRYVVFVSDAGSLVSGDSNGQCDVFVKDLQTGITTLVSSDSEGNQAYGRDSLDPAISADGRYITFWSAARGLVPEDNDLYADIFVKDLQTGITTRVSTNSDGNPANGHSRAPTISGDGRYVAFGSTATNLVPGDTAAGIFVKDLQTGAIVRVSTDYEGNQGTTESLSPVISADGRYVVFEVAFHCPFSDGSGPTSGVLVKDWQTGTTVLVRLGDDRLSGEYISYGTPSLSDDGRYVAFTRCILTPSMSQGASGETAVSVSTRSEVFVVDSQAGNVVFGMTDDSCSQPQLSADGQYLVFTSDATSLHPNETEILDDVYRVSIPVDQPATVEFSQWYVGAGSEDSGGKPFQVLVNGVVLTDQTIQLQVIGTTASPGIDYTFPATVTIPAGNYDHQLVPLDVTILPDRVVEANESIRLQLGQMSSGLKAGDVNGDSETLMTSGYTILNDDTATLSIDSVTHSEGDSGTTLFVFTVTLSNDVDVPVFVDYATANGTAIAGGDYAATSGTLTFSGMAGETQTITVVVKGDRTVETDEHFWVVLSNVRSLDRPPFVLVPVAPSLPLDRNSIMATGVVGPLDLIPYDGALVTLVHSTGQGRILNDDAATLQVNSVVQTEGDSGTTQFVFTVSLSSDVEAFVLVDFATADGTAVAGSDYTATSGTLTFDGRAGERRTITVNVLGDRIAELEESFSVVLSGLSIVEPVYTFDCMSSDLDDRPVLWASDRDRDVYLVQAVGQGTILNDDTGVRLEEDGTLVVQGSDTRNDTINVVPWSQDKIAVYLNGAWAGAFAGCNRIVAHGGRGYDRISISPTIRTSAFLYGEAGNDTLIGGAGDDVLVGGEGDDVLRDARGRNILISGKGMARSTRASVLDGRGSGESILISGWTDYDSHDVALQALLSEWARTDLDATTRIGNLRAGTGLANGFQLSSATVHDNDARDVIYGGRRNDWCFARTNRPQRDIFAGRNQRMVIEGV